MKTSFAKNLRRALLLGLLLLAQLAQGQRPPLTQAQYQEDFDYLWQTVQAHYAYFPRKQTDWPRVRQYYRPQLDTLTRRAAFVRVLKNTLGELYDNHVGLTTNRPDSRRLLPSGTDLWATLRRGQAVVVAVRHGFGAERVGVRPGMRIDAVNGVAMGTALAERLGHLQAQRHPDSLALEVALNQVLAGDHLTPRVLAVHTPAGQALTLRPDEPGAQLEHIQYPALIEVKRFGNIGYLKINNCLFDNRLISVFDSALTALADTKGLLLDLRETPSGGNTSVARAIMGRFTTQERPYQKHELPEEEAATGIRRSWLELVSPRPQPYQQPVVVLAGHWTGSMGEGLTLGLATMPRVRVIGTALARLNGAVYSYKLPNSGIGFTLPVERLYQVNGQPREAYQPTPYPFRLLQATPGADADIGAGLALLRQAQTPPRGPAKPK